MNSTVQNSSSVLNTGYHKIFDIFLSFFFFLSKQTSTDMCIECAAVCLVYLEVASFKYAIISSHSLFFLIPAKFILVPRMYFLGFCR